MAKILWLGDAGCHSGFGTVTHEIADRLIVNYGHDVHALAVNWRGDPYPTNIKLYLPTMRNGSDMYGQGRIVELMDRIRPDVVIMLNDPFVIAKMLFANKWDPDKILLQARPILSYVPIDGTNQPSSWRVVQEVTTTVLMSMHGRTWAPKSPVVYHGVDTFQYRPASEFAPLISSGNHMVTDKQSAKQALGYDPDSFLVVRVDRNSRRKDYASTWKALLPVMHEHDNVIAHFHCQAVDDGFELAHMFSRHPSLANRFFLPGYTGPDLSWTKEDLAILYNAADVFVSTSWGEGFGLTLAEAASCGVPVVAQNVSSIPEVVGDGGLLLKPKDTIAVPSGQDQWLPDIDAFSHAIEYLYTAEAARTALGKRARRHVENTFSWEEAARSFDVLIDNALHDSENGDINE